MEEAILRFASQFEFDPEIENKERLKKSGLVIVAGMGGSHLAADIILAKNPSSHMLVYSNYGLPKYDIKALKKALIICSSYSGNTEEVIDTYKEAIDKGLNVAVITKGGELGDLANKNKTPIIKFPSGDIQPRMALGYSLRAILKFIGDDKAYNEAGQLAKHLKVRDYKEEGEKLSEILLGKLPIIYSSERNRAIAYNWKIKFNENTKIPAFYNVFPELNHNGMNGFDVRDSTRELSPRFFFVELIDKEDDERIQNRMELFKNIVQEKGFGVHIVNISGTGRYHRIFSSVILADWASYFLALKYDIDPASVPMVEDFKSRL